MAARYPSTNKRSTSEDQAELIEDQYQLMVKEQSAASEKQQLSSSEDTRKLEEDFAALNLHQQIPQLTQKETKKLCKEDIQDIVNIETNLTYAHLRRLYHGLGMNDAEVQVAETNANTFGITDLRLQAQCVLNYWLNKKAHEATRGQIIKALDMKDLIEAKEHLEVKWGLATRALTDVSDDDIEYIVRDTKLSYTSLVRDLFGALGVSGNEIEDIEITDNTKDVRLLASKVFKQWRMKNGGKASRTNIIEALKKVGYKEAQYSLEQHWGLASTDISQVSVESFNLHKCHEELRTFYLKDYGKVNLLPWIPEETREMDSIFTDLNLKLVRNNQGTGKSYQTLECNEKLVTFKDTHGKRENRVLVTGDGGSGKSTLLDNIAYKWALNDPQSPLSKFSLVFLLRMKDVASSSSLVDLIFQNILSDDSTVSKEGLGMYIRDNEEDILFLIDGLDEVSCDVLKNKSGDVPKILYDRKNRQSCVILTTRPEYVVNLEEHISHYLQIKLEGFSSSSVEEYITKFFGCDEEKISSLIKKLMDEPHIQALVSIPVLLLMICVLWEDQSCMPRTKTQLYKETIIYMWKRYNVKCGRDPTLDNSDGEFQKELKDLLIKLGEVALRNTSISENIYTYPESDFGEDVCSLGCKVGILTKERSRSGLMRKTSVTFLHGTFHQFSAAFCLAFLLQSKKAQLDDFHGKLFDIQPDSIYYQPSILEFCCGLYPQATEDFFQYHLTKHPQKHLLSHQFSIPMYVHLANIFESQFSFDQYAKLRKPIPCSSNLYLEIDHSDIASVLYLLGLYRASGSNTGILSAINKLNIRELWYTPSWIPDLLKNTTNLQGFAGSVSSSSTSANRDLLYRALSMLPNLSQVHFTNANSTQISLDITNLIKFFTENRIRLVKLSLLGFHYDDKVMAKYLSSISTSVVLLELAIMPLQEMQYQYTVKELFAILPTLKQLSVLNLRLPVSSGIKYLRPIIRQLEKLVLMHCRLKEKHLKELLTFLSRAKKLKKLNLSCNDGLFSGSLVDTFVDTLNQLPALEELYVCGSGLSEESERTLLKFAEVKPSMRVLASSIISVDVQSSYAASQTTSC